MDAVRGLKTAAQLAAEHQVHPTVVASWKQQLLKGAAALFEDGRKAAKAAENETLVEELYRKIGVLQVENDFLKKKSGRL